MRFTWLAGLLCLCTTMTQAKIDLVTLPQRDQVQLTIYNAADLTLVREQRILTLRQGINRLEFGWADTLIDPTSVDLNAPQHAAAVKLLSVSYPPNVKGSAIWHVESTVAGEIPVEISFFTSGLSWESFYHGTLSTDEQYLHLQNYVRINNNSGEDYNNAQTRVIVGQINLEEAITELAQRDAPYGSPQDEIGDVTDSMMYLAPLQLEELVEAEESRKAKALFRGEAKKIIKKGLSEYFIYQIEGTEDIAHGWGKRLLSMEAEAIPVRALYRDGYPHHGDGTQRFLYFKNDKQHQLGTTPLPNGEIVLYRQLDAEQHLSYLGTTHVDYIPMQQEVELHLGVARQVEVKALLMQVQTQNYEFDPKGNISGHDTVQTWQLNLRNGRDISVDLEVFRCTDNAYWQLQQSEASTLPYDYEKVDVDTFKYRVTLPPHSKHSLSYTLTLYHGSRQINR